MTLIAVIFDLCSFIVSSRVGIGFLVLERSRFHTLIAPSPPPEIICLNIRSKEGDIRYIRLEENKEIQTFLTSIFFLRL